VKHSVLVPGAVLVYVTKTGSKITLYVGAETVVGVSVGVGVGVGVGIDVGVSVVVGSSEVVVVVFSTKISKLRPKVLGSKLK
jgi:hypothetical protein